MKSERRNLVIALLSLWFLVGCGGSNSRIDIRLGLFAGSCWNVPTNNSYIAYDEAIRLYAHMHPDTSVSFKSGILREDYSEWLSQRIIQEEEPDLFLILPEDFSLLASLGILAPLDHFLEQDNSIETESFFPNVLEAGKSGGTLYALPMELDTTLMLVNTSLLKEECIPLPDADWTWTDFLNICRLMTSDTDGDGRIDRFGITGYDWTYSVYSNGETLFDQSGRESYFDNSGVIDAFTFLATLNSLSEEERVPDFESGRVAFAPYNLSFYRAYGYYPYNILRFGDFDMTASVLPRGPGGKNAADLKVLMIGISSRSSQKKESWEFLKFMLESPQIQASMLQNSRGIPPHKNLLLTRVARDMFLDDFPQANIAISEEVITRSIEESIIVPRFRRYQGAIDMVSDDLKDIPLNQSQLVNILNTLNREIEDYLLQ